LADAEIRGQWWVPRTENPDLEEHPLFRKNGRNLRIVISKTAIANELKVDSAGRSWRIMNPSCLKGA
jgi:hypothetical protein